MTSQGNTDLVRVLEPFFGDDTQARIIGGIICQFSGYMCGDKGYMQFRAGVMTLVFRAQAIGAEGTQIYLTELPMAHQTINRSYMNWITSDLTFLGYHVCVRIRTVHTSQLRAQNVGNVWIAQARRQ